VVRIQNTDVSAVPPNENQLLTYIGGEWQPADPAPPVISDLVGDVIGPGDDNTVVKIQNVDVAPTGPTENQLLTFRGGQWQPADPPTGGIPNLNGDVIGAPDANTVVKIQNVNVASTAPAHGQVLTFDAGVSQWMPRNPTGGPVTGDFVEHPPGLPRYFIVAAGIVRGDGTNRPEFPPYNGLKAGTPGGPILLVTFDGYAVPDGNFLYIVKAMPVFDDRFLLVTINFLNFGSDGIQLFITNAGRPVESLAEMEFVIEVSLYESDQGVIPPIIGPRAVAATRPPVNLNTATLEELRTLPRIGPELASRILEARQRRRGGFKSLRDLLKVEGIGEDVLSVIEPFVKISRR
jgi:hypothetical protein